MKIEVYKCENCGKETKDYYKEKGWIRIDKWGLQITGGRAKDGYGSAIINRSTDLIVAPEGSDGADFCSLRCFIRWLYLSKDTDNGCDRDAFLKEAIKSIVEDEFLKRIIIDCLDSESEGD